VASELGGGHGDTPANRSRSPTGVVSSRLSITSYSQKTLNHRPIPGKRRKLAWLGGCGVAPLTDTPVMRVCRTRLVAGRPTDR
jgi:hypothetical protein